jgi:hypothetical protein
LARRAIARRESPPAPHQVLEIARDYLGMPYAWGGAGRSGFDCSGFTSAVFAQVGYGLPRTSREQYKIGLEVPRSALQVADLLFFVSSPGGRRITHVGIYAGDGEIIHAATGKGEVTYDRLASRYYSARLLGARRILALPPGSYSTRRGLARPGAFFASGELVDVAPVGRSRIPPGDEIGLLIASLTEHEGQEPPQLATRLVAEPVTQVGPRFLREDATAVGVRTAAGRINDRGAVLLVPEVSYFGHDTALRGVLAVPLLIPAGGAQPAGDSFAAQWDTASDYTKVIQRLSYGRKDSRLYADLGRTASATLGHGQIMRFYTPNIASRFVPPFTIEPDALSLTFDASRASSDLELFIDDLLAPQVVGLHAGLRPLVLFDRGSRLLRTLTVGTNYAVDLRAPVTIADGAATDLRTVHGVGVEASLTPHASPGFDLETFADVSALVRANGAGVGGAVGGRAHAHFKGRRRHVLRGRLEMRISGPAFIPSYYDTTYRLNRFEAPVDSPPEVAITKLALLEGLKDTPVRWGVYGEMTYQYGRRLHLGFSYEDGGALGSLPASNSYTGRSLMLFANVRNLYLPASSRRLDLYLAYHLRNFGELFPLLGSNRVNEYLFLALSVQMWRFLAVGGSIRKAGRVQEEGAAWDAVLELTLRYEI